MADIVQGPLVLDLLRHIFKDRRYLDQVNGFTDEEIHAGGISLADQLLGGNLGDHDAFDGGVEGAQLADEFHPVHDRHEKVHQDHIGPGPQDLMDVGGLSAAVAADLAKISGLHDILQDMNDRNIIFDNIDTHQFTSSRAPAGIWIRNRVPRPGSDSTEMVPLNFSSTVAFTP